MCDENGIRACLNVRFDKWDKVAASVVHRAVGLGPVAHERRNRLDSSKSEPRRFAAPTHRAGKHVADRDAQTPDIVSGLNAVCGPTTERFRLCAQDGILNRRESKRVTSVRSSPHKINGNGTAPLWNPITQAPHRCPPL